jgi:hypothetical protein
MEESLGLAGTGSLEARVDVVDEVTAGVEVGLLHEPINMSDL